MLVRAATDQDVPAIVKLLRQSLGDMSSEKSEAYWTWKHLQNPFGPSPVLVAEEDGKLVGVRAMMPWQWQQGNHIYRALRAVDTATHPAHQGKGIFSKLTRQMVEQAKAEGYDFIFNTPNKQSKPGYLKMGWQELGRLSIGLRFTLPFSIIKSQTHVGAYLQSTAAVSQQSKDLEQLCAEWNSCQLAVDSKQWAEKNTLTHAKTNAKPANCQLLNANLPLYTPKSPAYLNWRYRNNPIIRYSIREHDDFYIAVCLRKRSFVREMRVAELIWRDAKGVKKKINKTINELATLYRANVISFAPIARPVMGGLHTLLPLGPVLTFRSLQEGMDVQGIHWKFAIGDLELF